MKTQNYSSPINHGRYKVTSTYYINYWIKAFLKNANDLNTCLCKGLNDPVEKNTSGYTMKNNNVLHRHTHCNIDTSNGLYRA